VNEYASWTPTFSKTSSVKGVGKGSCKKESFNFLKSTQIRIPPCLFYWTTIGLIHSDSSSGSMIPNSNIWSISTFTFCLYPGFSLYGLFLIGLASFLRGIFISPSYPAMSFIYVKFFGNRSLYSCSNSIILSTFCSSQ
jgi:hypothetical protein